MKLSLNKIFIKSSAAVSLICIAYSIVFLFSDKNPLPKEPGKSPFEDALYTRTEFFGAEAIVPFPTNEARERLAKILENDPNNAAIYVKLSELDEKLGRFAEAEAEIKKASELEPEKINELLNFYRRRAEYEKEAATLEKMLAESSGERRTGIFSRLVLLAETHDLQKYLKTEFYGKVLAEQPQAFPILAQYLDGLIEENPAAALKFLRENKSLYPEHAGYFLEKELSLVSGNEAEQVYHAAFDPFWTEEESRNYYDFLSENDRYRAYGKELKTKFYKNPSDFDTAIRLIHFEKYDYDSITEIVLKLETARAEKNIRWTSEELLIVSRFLLAERENDTASRFLYTLFLQEDVKQEKSRMRARVLYQIFRIFIESETDKLTLAKGDLQFYKNIARADTNPGIATGILSLIFAGTNPSDELEQKERTAARFFNRAAAFQIFSEYKKEFPTSPELASMYLDIVKIYTAEKDLETAAETLVEFGARYEKADDFPPVALKLAEAFQIAGKTDEERQIYQQILDRLGASFEKKEFQTYPLFFETNSRNFSQTYQSKEKPDDFLPNPARPITYKDVLQRFVASLDRDKKSNEIFAFYTAELQKYPDQAELYEQFLAWLEKTDLTEEQIKIYRQAIAKFPEKSWRDRLARWFIKTGRKQEFEDFSQNLLNNFNDEESRQFLAEFVDSNVADKPESFNGKLYFGLYSLAHKRFPHNLVFVRGLLNYYKSHGQEDQYRKLLAEYYFESPEIRQEFLADLAKKGEIRSFLDKSEEHISSPNNLENLPYKLFRADASAWISNFETAVEHYRELNELYPHTAAFADKLISLTRSFGQKERKLLVESAIYSNTQAENFPDAAVYRTRAGEIFAELGDYPKANAEWRKLIETARGENETYLETATVFWDYFQFPEAMETIKKLRQKQHDETLFAFQAGAIYEAEKDLPSALTEYVKALDSENAADTYQTKKRLKTLIKREKVAERLEKAFLTEKAKLKNPARLTFGYCEFLNEIGQIEKAGNLLKQEVWKSVEIDFLEDARNFFSYAKRPESERFVIKRLAEISGKSRKAFSYQLQLGKSYADEGNITDAAAVLNRMLAANPFNYGVIIESSNFFRRIGERERAADVLQNALQRGRGEYRYHIARKLASLLISQNRLPPAEDVLLLLNTENKEDTEVIDELTNIYVQTNQTEKLRNIADEKIKAIKKRDEMPRDLKFEIIETRKRLVNAFTRLKDYRSAIEQQIEIINLEPDAEENIDEAVKYVKRFGGADTLLDYYRKTSAEAYKNYRWNVVLAKIYEAKDDFQNAAENYKIAIHNQPENIDLYDALAENFEKSNDFTAALDAINKILELAGEDRRFIKRKIKLLEKLGKSAEAEVERQKLPAENLSKTNSLAEQLQAAANLRNTEQAKASALYCDAFDKVYENPAESILNSSDVSGYVQTVRHEENLDEIYKKLWRLREKLAFESDRQNSTEAGKIRDLLSILDGAMPEAVCATANSNATGNELSAIFSDIENRLAQTGNNQFKINSLLQNLINNCGFTELNEKILIRRKDEAFGSNNSKDFHFRLRILIDFYDKRGDFPRILELLETERARDFDKTGFEYERLIADNARLLGNADKELNALRDYYNAVTQPSNQPDRYIGRYLDILYQTNREELENLTHAPNANILQLINFLISKKESVLAHATIENYSFPKIQKLTRNADASLALNEFEPANENYFLDALQLAPIGKLIGQKAEKDSAAVGNLWFETAEKYGEWLYFAQSDANKTAVREFLPAAVENRPNDANEQAKLGEFYLERKNFRLAFEHFKLAGEKNERDVSIKTNLGICYFQLGELQKASEIWNETIEPETASIADAEIYLKTLADYGQADKARENLKPFLIFRLRHYSESVDTAASENEFLQNFIGQMAKTFHDEQRQFEFFDELAGSVKYNSYLPEMIVRKRLVNKKYLGEFYKFIIRHSEKLPYYERDYDFTFLLEETYSGAEAELLLDQQKNYKANEPESERLRWQKEFLEFLLAENRTREAEHLIEEIENSLNGKFARPAWLRLANIRLGLRANSPGIFLQIKQFVGIEVSPNANEVKPPGIERLNEAVKVLQSENRQIETENLKAAFYTRMLALEQFDSANFTALAQILFARGESETGLNLLKLMNDLAGEEQKETAQAELAELVFIKKYAVKDVRLFETEAFNNLNLSGSLQTAAEICARFGHFAEAEFYRQQLFELAPENEPNRLELARIFWINSKADDALKTLAEIIGNRETDRTSRWQAVLIASEIFAGNAEMWEKLKTDLQTVQQKDAEMWSAIEIISLSKTGRADEAFDYAQKDISPFSTPQFSLLIAVIAKEAGQEAAALQGFLDISDKNSELDETFGAFYERPLWQAIRLYLKLGKPLAALKLAEKESDLQFENLPQISNFAYLSPAEKSVSDERNSRFELLRLLSIAAEENGEVQRAANLEKTRLKLALDDSDRKEIRLRIEKLQIKIQ